MIQMCAATLVEAASALALSLMWTLVGLAFGLSLNTSQQLLIWMLLTCRIATGTFDFEGDIEGCATLMFFAHLCLEIG